MGRVRWMVENAGILREESVDNEVGEVVRCFPPWTRRRSDGGREVRSERSCRRVAIEVDKGMIREMAADVLACRVG